MKVLFITGVFPRLTFIFRAIVAIAEQGHEVTVIARNPGDWKPFEEDIPLPSNLKVKYFIPDTRLFSPKRFSHFIVGLVTAILRAPIASWQLSKLCRQQSTTFKETLRLFVRHLPLLKTQTDIVQFEFYLAKSQYPLLDKIIDAPTIVSCRGADIHIWGTLSEEAQRERLQSLQTASLIHCVSDEMARSVTLVSGRTEGLWVNRPAIPVNKIASKKAYNTNSTPVIVTTGRLDWKKGHDYFLAALRRLKDAGVPFRAQIIGGGDLQAQMRFSVEDIDLSPEVELVGRLKPDEVFDYLEKADVFVLSSHEEGISNAVLEAMAVGLPIVTTAAGGMEEAVRDGLDGYVIPVRDIPAMVEKLTTLLGDHQLRERMGRSARERVEAEFTLERQATVFSQMYEAATRSQRLSDTIPTT